MSQATRTAVIARLMADTTLAGMLATDPNTGNTPAIFMATRNTAPPVYPSLTYRISSANPDSKFMPGLPDQGGDDVVNEYFEFEAWTQTPDSAPVESIAARLDIAFQYRTLTGLTDGSNVFYAQRDIYLPDLYDKTLNAWFGLIRYHLRVQTTGPAAPA